MEPKNRISNAVTVREFAVFFAMLSAVIIIFFWPVLFEKAGFYYGDYKQQFYPWASYLSQHLKLFSLPLWASEIGCGFPLLAEGQSAALSPLNWVLSFFLPFPFSYHAGFIILFLMAGVFNYIFLRECGLRPEGSAFATLAFLFGSAYAGLFYGLMALRTLVWFPLSFYWIQKMTAGGNHNRLMVFLAATWAMSFLGGYPQMACYGVFAGFIYFSLKVFWGVPLGKKRSFAYFAGAALLSAGLSAVQILPTLELAAQSGRAGVGESFALQKSLIPMNIFTLLWPDFGAFMGFDFYIGLLPILLAFLALTGVKKNRLATLFAVEAFFFLFLAFGLFNPFYKVFIQAAHFYLFRVPSKFIYFSCFFLSALSGIGLDMFCSGSLKFRQRFMWITGLVFGVALVIYFAARALIWDFRHFVLEWGQGFVRTWIFGREGHPHTLNDYFFKLQNLLDFAKQRTQFPDNPEFKFIIFLWILIGLGVIFKKRLFKKRLF